MLDFMVSVCHYTLGFMTCCYLAGKYINNRIFYVLNYIWDTYISSQ